MEPRTQKEIGNGQNSKCKFFKYRESRNIIVVPLPAYMKHEELLLVILRDQLETLKKKVRSIVVIDQVKSSSIVLNGKKQVEQHGSLNQSSHDL